MAKVNVFIWYDSNGRIAATGRPGAHCKAIPVAAHNLHTLMADVEEELVGRLHHTHAVDVRKGAVVPRTQTKT